MTTKFRIQRATTQADLEAVFGLRYRVYVEEMRRPQKDADHRGRRIKDALDGFARIFAASASGDVVGTVRCNILGEGDIGPYREWYAIDREHARSPLASITTRFMVLPAYRRTGLAVDLTTSIYRHALEEGVEWDYIDCNPHLLHFFTRLGYRPHRTDLVHPEYGAVTVLRLAVNDLAHLEAVRSPFARVLREYRSRERRIA